MTPEEALANLEAIRDAVPDAMAEGRRALGQAAVRELKRVWPVGEPRKGHKHSRDEWRYDEQEGQLKNDAPHVEFVHDGLVFRLVPEVLARLQPLYRDTVTARLDEAGRT